MAFRPTIQDIAQAVIVVNNQLKAAGKENRVHVEFAYGQPRILLASSEGRIEREIGPRGTKTEVYRWLCMFSAGLAVGLGATEGSEQCQS